MRPAHSSTTSANASLPASRSSIGRRRHAGSILKKRYETYCPTWTPSMRSYPGLLAHACMVRGSR